MAIYLQPIIYIHNRYIVDRFNLDDGLALCCLFRFNQYLCKTIYYAYVISIAASVCLDLTLFCYVYTLTMAPSVLEKERTFGFVELTTRLRKLHACISDTDNSHT